MYRLRGRDADNFLSLRTEGPLSDLLLGMFTIENYFILKEKNLDPIWCHEKDDSEATRTVFLFSKNKCLENELVLVPAVLAAAVLAAVGIAAAALAVPGDVIM